MHYKSINNYLQFFYILDKFKLKINILLLNYEFMSLVIKIVI